MIKAAVLQGPYIQMLRLIGNLLFKHYQNTFKIKKIIFFQLFQSNLFQLPI